MTKAYIENQHWQRIVKYGKEKFSSGYLYGATTIADLGAFWDKFSDGHIDNGWGVVLASILTVGSIVKAFNDLPIFEKEDGRLERELKSALFKEELPKTAEGSKQDPIFHA